MKMNLERIWNHLVVELEDNGDWEYTREGIGVYEGRVFLVDLDDSGESSRELLFVKEGLQVHQVLAIGKETGRYVQDEEGSFWYNWDIDGDKESARSFREQVGISN